MPRPAFLGPELAASPDADAMQVLVSNGSQNYTGRDALQLLKDLGLKQQVGLLSQCCPASECHPLLHFACKAL